MGGVKFKPQGTPIGWPVSREILRIQRELFCEEDYQGQDYQGQGLSGSSLAISHFKNGCHIEKLNPVLCLFCLHPGLHALN